MVQKTDKKLIVGVIGLGYVGLPLAVEFSKQEIPVIGYDLSVNRINQLKEHCDLSGELTSSELKKAKINYTNDPIELRSANFLIAAIPTPVNEKNKPDLSLLKEASATIGRNLSRHTTVVFESTVYPGVTEEICMPIIEQTSGLKCGEDWFIGYSPERINPGDKQHNITNIVKIVSGMDKKTLKKIARVYKIVCKAGVFESPSIKTAEMAKVFENIQRDVNIALVNELSLICHRMGMEAQEVLSAAGTKWNFLKFRPGLVGGHCVGVDPYYLVEKAKKIGYRPQIIMSAREINNYMPQFIAEEAIKAMDSVGKKKEGYKVLIMGLTFKENVRDTRNSKITVTISTLKKFGAQVYGYDPNLTQKEIEEEFEVLPVEKLERERKLGLKTLSYDAVIINVCHRQFNFVMADVINLMSSPAIVIDVTGVYKDKFKKSDNLIYKKL